jgi:hypothetical protein
VDTSNATEQIDQDRRRLLGTATTGIVVTGAAIAVALAVLEEKAISAQDKYTVQVPNGLAFPDFRGYENWKVVAVSDTENSVKAIVANPTMMAARRPSC